MNYFEYVANTQIKINDSSDDYLFPVVGFCGFEPLPSLTGHTYELE
jgi:hypothetical protein